MSTIFDKNFCGLTDYNYNLLKMQLSTPDKYIRTLRPLWALRADLSESRPATGSPELSLFQALNDIIGCLLIDDINFDGGVPHTVKDGSIVYLDDNASPTVCKLKNKEAATLM